MNRPENLVRAFSQQTFLLAGSLAGTALLSALACGSQVAAEQIPRETKQQVLQKSAGSEDKSELHQLANELILRFYSALSKTGTPTGTIGLTNGNDKKLVNDVQKLLDKAFIVQRADGSFATYHTYTPVDIDDYKILDLHATQPKPGLLVTRFKLLAKEALNPKTGMVSSDEPLPRLSVFRWNPERGDWLLLSHANFDAPSARLCNHQQAAIETFSNIVDPGKRSDQRLANRLLDTWYKDLSRDGLDIALPGRLLLKSSQLVYGDGYGRDGNSGYRKVKAGTTERRNLITRRHGDDLVLRFEARNRLTINDSPYQRSWQPRLVTITKMPNSEYKIASFAIFVYPQRPPADKACIAPTSP